MQSGPLIAPAVEGAFANNRNPRLQVLAGPDALVAGIGSLLPAPGGCILGRFAWANGISGQAFNAQADAGGPGALLGLALPYNGRWVTWQAIYGLKLADGTFVRVLRPGLGITLCNKGDFWVKFAGGSNMGQPVYVNPLDGTAISGYAIGAILTPWSVVTTTAPGGLAIISTWSKYT